MDCLESLFRRRPHILAGMMTFNTVVVLRPLLELPAIGCIHLASEDVICVEAFMFAVSPWLIPVQLLALVGGWRLVKFLSRRGVTETREVDDMNEQAYVQGYVVQLFPVWLVIPILLLLLLGGWKLVKLLLMALKG